MPVPDKETIAQLNDHARKNLHDINVVRMVVTPGIMSLVGRDTKRHKKNTFDLYTKLIEYSNFSPDNDPYGEHDFGQIEIDGNKIFWKIDYHPKNNSEYVFPADATKTIRVLTIMLADEY